MSTRARRGGVHGLAAPPRAVAAVAACMMGLSCGSTTAEVLSPASAAIDGGGAGASATDAASPSRAGYCSGRGAPILVGDPDGGAVSA